MWKKPSKFKNTFPEAPKREECIYDLPISTSNSSNNGIKCNFNLLAFEIDGEGGKLGILPLNSKGRKLRHDLTIVCAHSDKIADFQFSNFTSQNLLVTCAKDEPVKIFNIDQTLIDSNASFSTPSGQISNLRAKNDGNLGPDCSCLAFHTTAENLLAVSNANFLHICDLNKETSVLTVDHLNEKISSISWKNDGKLLAALDRSQNLSIIDPRNKENSLFGTISCHSGAGRENRVLFLGEESKILTTGFTKQKTREISLFDERDLTKPLHSMQFEPSTGILMPFYDLDTKLLFLAGKGSTKIQLFEFINKEPFFAEAASYASNEQTYGACLVPKICLNVMQTEVDRLIQVSKNKLTPISYKVPRKTFRDFHSDLYPNTVGKLSGLSADDWFAGQNKNPPKFDLNPEKKHLLEAGIAENGQIDENLQTSKNLSTLNGNNNEKSIKHDISNELNENFGGHVTNHVTAHKPSNQTTIVHKPNHVTGEISVIKPSHVTSGNGSKSSHVTSGNSSSKTSHVISHYESAGKDENDGNTNACLRNHVTRLIDVNNHVTDKSKRSSWHPTATHTASGDHVTVVNEDHVTEKQPQAVKRSNTLFTGLRPSKFRHVTVGNGNNVLYTNLRHVTTRLPIESGGFCTSTKFAAIPLNGAGGPVAILDVRKKAKLPDDKIPAIENGALVNDLQFSPFNDNFLAIGCDNGVLNLWSIPEDGLEDNIQIEPEYKINAHDEKIVFVRFNPIADQILATCDKFGCIKIWNLSSFSTFSGPIIEFSLNTQLISLCWNFHGNFMASIDKYGNLVLFDPRKFEEKLEKPNVIQSTKAARVLFVCNDEMLLICSFSKSSDRAISLYSTKNLEQLCTKSIDVSPQLLIPYYDFDTSVLFLTGKGDRTIYMFEISRRHPYFLELNSYRAPNAHQSLSFAPKFTCNVANVEIASGFRLKLTDLEKISFTVPRRKMDHFQNDIFVDALITWAPLQQPNDWLAKKPVNLKFKSLKPENMELLYPDLLTSKNSVIENKENVQEDFRPPKIGPGPQFSAEKSTNLTADSTPEENFGNFPVEKLNLQKSPTLNEQAEIDKFEKIDAIDFDDPQNRMFQIAEKMGKRMDMLDVKDLEQDKMEGVDEKEWS